MGSHNSSMNVGSKYWSYDQYDNKKFKLAQIVQSIQKHSISQLCLKLTRPVSTKDSNNAMPNHTIILCSQKLSKFDSIQNACDCAPEINVASMPFQYSFHTSALGFKRFSLALHPVVNMSDFPMPLPQFVHSEEEEVEIMKYRNLGEKGKLQQQSQHNRKNKAKNYGEVTEREARTGNCEAMQLKQCFSETQKSLFQCNTWISN